MDSRIFLVGPPGAGKSAVGRRLAAALGYEFLDSDHYLEERTGVDIAYIFEKEGEAGFRKREADAIDALTQRDRVVLATGGGAILAEDNRRHLAGRGTVVYLQASVAQQFARVQHSQHRPLLREDDPRAVLERLFEIRDPLYREIADVTISTDGAKVARVTEQLRDALRAGTLASE